MNDQETIDARADLLDFIRALRAALSAGVPRGALGSALDVVLIDEDDPTEVAMTLRRVARATPRR